MRRLLFVPIVHQTVDLGSVGTALSQQSGALLGETRWRTHLATVSGFWESVAAYLRTVDARELRIYQDGLAAEGELGRQVVREAARRGSKNFQLILELLEGGATLRKTEDAGLLLQERENLLSSLQGEPLPPARPEFETHQQQRGRLLHRRDRFIADTINRTLKEAELGLLFIGADHNVLEGLSSDIAVESLKDGETVRSYFNELFLGHDDERLEPLAQRLTAPVPSR